MTDWQTNLINDSAGIAAVIRDTKTIAVLGIKPESHADQAGYYVPAHMAEAGYDIIPVPVYYPEVTKILGKPVFRKLSDIGRSIDMVNVFRRPNDIPLHVDDIIAAKPKSVWFQLGIRNDEAAQRLAEAGIKVVQDRCLMVEEGRIRREPAVSVTRRVDLPPFTFWETRAGSGTPLVLLHGLGGSSDWWRHNIDVLSERYLISAVDLIGFGRNRFFLRRSKLPLRFDDIAALLARWIESFFDGPVHLAGNSLGGQISIHLAASRPDLIRSLILIDSTGIPFEIAPGAHIENIVLPHGWRSFLLVLARDLFRAGPTALAVAFARLLRDDARPLMRKLMMPVLLVWGEHDPLVPLTYAKQMLDEMPHAKLRVIPRAGHVPMWENPRAFNEAVLSFLDEVDVVHGLAEPAFSWGLSGWTNGIAHRA